MRTEIQQVIQAIGAAACITRARKKYGCLLSVTYWIFIIRRKRAAEETMS